MNESADYDDEVLNFLKGLRRYIAARSLAIYIIVAIATVAFGIIFYYFMYWILPPPYALIMFILILIGFIVGLNVLLQRSLLIHHLPPYTLEIAKKAGFKIVEFKINFIFKRANVYPTPNTFIRIGLLVGYIPFMEWRFKSYKISLTSKKLCEKEDLMGALIVQEIAERNLLAWDSKGDGKRVGVTRKKISGLRFKSICLPEEVTGRLMQMGKAIRQWERALGKIAKFALSN